MLPPASPRLQALLAVVIAVVALTTIPVQGAAQGIECVSCTTWSVSVTPDGGTASAPALATGQTASFTVTNTGQNTTSTYALTCTSPPLGGTCSVTPSQVTLGPGQQTNVTATYGTGPAGIEVLGLSAVDDAHEVGDGGTRNVTITGPGAPVISLASHAASARIVGACAAACFDAVYARGGPGYVSMGVGRGVTLVYNSSTHKPVPVVSVDVSNNAQTTPAPSHYKVEVRRRPSGTLLTLLNGNTSVYFTVSSVAPTRLWPRSMSRLAVSTPPRLILWT